MLQNYMISKTTSLIFCKCKNEELSNLFMSAYVHAILEEVFCHFGYYRRMVIIGRYRSFKCFKVLISLVNFR
jgi:hypothetical protein